MAVSAQLIDYVSKSAKPDSGRGTLTVERRRRTFEPSAPKVRTGEDERSGKCGIQVGMFLGRLSDSETRDVGQTLKSVTLRVGRPS